MKIRIIGLNGSETHTGIFGKDGEIEPGTEFEIKDEPPAAWAGKFETISKGPAKGAQPIINELPALTGKNKAELIDIAKAENVAIEADATNADIVSAIELAREANA